MTGSATVEAARAEKPSEDQILDAWYHLQFGVKTSIRYHRHRVRFFKTLGFATDLLVILSGASVISLSHSSNEGGVLVAAGVLVSLLTGVDLVVKYGHRARDYEEYCRRFHELLRRMNSVPIPTAASLAECQNLRLNIEQDEPPHLIVLNLRCHNEEARAQECDPNQFIPIGFWRTVCSEVFDLAPSRLKKGLAKPPPILPFRS